MRVTDYSKHPTLTYAIVEPQRPPKLRVLRGKPWECSEANRAQSYKQSACAQQKSFSQEGPQHGMHLHYFLIGELLVKLVGDTHGQ
jgi:hypothetical protein